MLKKFCLWGSLAAALVFVPSAGATLQLTLSSGATTLVINDNGPICNGSNGPACDSNSAVGQITYIGAVGNWNLNVTTGTLGTNPILDLSSVDTVKGSGTGANSLTLKFSATNLPGPQLSGFSANVGGTLATNTTLMFSAYVDNTNTLYGMGTQVGSTLTFTNPPLIGFSGGQNGAAGAITAALYSGTEIVNISSVGPSGTSSFDAQLDTVPEPAGVLLLGGVLLLTTGAIRRKLGSRRN
jgi:hypothetical protein